jgi:hypothetical protein
MYTIERETYPHTVRLGNRLIVRGFKTNEDMHRFLNTGDNAAPGKWRESTKGLKPGTYAYAGGQWHNVKNLDVSALAHI